MRSKKYPPHLWSPTPFSHRPDPAESQRTRSLGEGLHTVSLVGAEKGGKCPALGLQVEQKGPHWPHGTNHRQGWFGVSKFRFPGPVPTSDTLTE